MQTKLQELGIPKAIEECQDKCVEASKKQFDAEHDGDEDEFREKMMTRQKWSKILATVLPIINGEITMKILARSVNLGRVLSTLLAIVFGEGFYFFFLGISLYRFTGFVRVVNNGYKHSKNIQFVHRMGFDCNKFMSSATSHTSLKFSSIREPPGLHNPNYDQG